MPGSPAPGSSTGAEPVGVVAPGSSTGAELVGVVAHSDVLGWREEGRGFLLKSIPNEPTAPKTCRGYFFGHENFDAALVLMTG